VVLLNNELSPEYSISRAGTDFTFSDGDIPDGKFNAAQLRFIFKEGLPIIRDMYCTDLPYWNLARAINYNLLWFAFDDAGNTVLADRITPQECGSAPADNSGGHF
jgi:hypothetical protein